MSLSYAQKELFILAPRTMLEQNHIESYSQVMACLQFIEDVLRKIHKLQSCLNSEQNHFTGFQYLVLDSQKVNTDLALTKTLKKIFKHRNRLAHTYLMEHCLEELGGISDYELFTKTIYLMKLHVISEAVLTKLLRELRTIPIMP